MGKEEKANVNSRWYQKRHPKLSVVGGSIAVEGESFFHKIIEAIKRFIKKCLA